ncbi:hypothetical protein [uncultured Erythrobacter sp.]|uniref:hypothetical protein n=1 Tax=uncultured Erythrobacter sp. TaxID=263913 RepID=UPI002631F7DC|nr:hypothetical protein [uncultured Erythrobacter sp.]
MTLKVDFETEVEISAKYPASEYFVLDYAALSSETKTSSFKVTFHENRMISAVNVAAQDQSINIAVETLKAGFAIARLATGVPVPMGAPNLREQAFASCPMATVATNRLDDNGQVVFEQQPLVELRAKIASDRKSKVEALASVNTRLAALNAIDADKLSDAQKDLIGTLTEQGKALAGEIKKFDTQIAEFDRTLAFSEVFAWRPSGVMPETGYQSREFDFRENDATDIAGGIARQAWINKLFNQKDNPAFGVFLGTIDPSLCTDDAPCDMGRFGPTIARELSITIQLRTQGFGLDDASVDAVRGRLGLASRDEDEPGGQLDHVAGIVARQPVPGQVIVCTGYGVPCSTTSAGKVVEQNVSVPQLGAYIVLPFSNGFGQNNVLNATFNTTGEPTMVEYKENSAVALEAAQAAGSSANALNSLLQDIGTTREADATAAANEPLEELQRQVGLLQQQQLLNQLQEQINPTNPVTILQQEVSVLEHQVRIAELQSNLNPQVDAYASRLQDLQRQLELLRLQVQIAEQEQLLSP